MSVKLTHIRLKTGNKVYVERQYNTVIVRSRKGKVLGSYQPDEMADFHKRYKKIKETASKGN